MDGRAYPETEGPGDRAESAAAAPLEPAADAHHAAKAALLALATGEVGRCPHCHGTTLHRWGKARKTMQRWRCCDCHRSFSTTTGTVLAGLHAPRKFAAVVIDMLSDQPSSCRRLASTLGMSRMTVWAWRQRINEAFAAALQGDGAPIGAGTTDAAPVVVRESRKASREWIDHRREPARHPRPDRHRWLDYRLRRLPLPSPMSPYLVPVMLLEDQFGHCRARVLQQSTTTLNIPETAEGEARPRLPNRLPDQLPDPGAGGVLPMTTGHSSPACAALSATVIPSTKPGGDHLRDRFQQFLRPFRGPATRYLSGYVAWFTARLTASDDTRLRRLVQELCSPFLPRATGL